MICFSRVMFMFEKFWYSELRWVVRMVCDCFGVNSVFRL